MIAAAKWWPKVIAPKHSEVGARWINNAWDLKKSPDLQERHRDAIKEMDEFLDESKKKDALKESPEA